MAPRAAQPFDGSAAETREANQSGPLLTLEQLQRIAEAGGRRLQLRTLGPFYRITCSSKGAHAQAANCSVGNAGLFSKGHGWRMFFALPCRSQPHAPSRTCSGEGFCVRCLTSY